MNGDSELLGLGYVIHYLVVISDLGPALTPHKLLLTRLYDLLLLGLLVFVSAVEVALLLEDLFEVLARELCDVLGAIPYDLFRVVLQDLREVSMHLDLIWRKDAHLSGICHRSLFDGLFFSY